MVSKKVKICFDGMSKKDVFEDSRFFFVEKWNSSYISESLFLSNINFTCFAKDVSENMISDLKDELEDGFVLFKCVLKKIRDSSVSQKKYRSLFW